MGGLTQSSSESKTHKDETTTTRPLPEQMVHLERAWGDADSLLTKTNANPYKGDFVAAPNKDQFTGFNDALAWSKGAARNTATNIGDAGANQLQSGTDAQRTALQGLYDRANGDPTQNNIKTAQAYANSQDIQGIVDAGTYAARRNAAENTLPSLYRGAAASGNVNSDRTAISEGIVNRGLAEQAQNLGATTTQQMYNQGLALAEANNNRQLQSIGAAGTLGNTMAAQGYGGSSAGFDMYGKALAGQGASAMGLQGLDQARIDNDLKKYLNETQVPWANLQNYYGIVGDLKGGTQHTVGDSTTNTTQTPSVLSSIGQGLGFFSSLFCDVRLKHVLSGPVGSLKGHNTYLFKYLDGFDPVPGRIHCSVMAQEVEKTHPEAVFEINGIKIVDTTKL